jgi:hypothetical protein
MSQALPAATWGNFHATRTISASPPMRVPWRSTAAAQAEADIAGIKLQPTGYGRPSQIRPGEKWIRPTEPKELPPPSLELAWSSTLREKKKTATAILTGARASGDPLGR